MSQEKAQLIAPIDSSFTVPGVTVSGVLTATTFDGTITGVADSITQGKNLNVGVITALSFAGNLTGDAGGLTGSPNTVAGVVTATSFIGGLTGNITGDVIGNATGVGGSILQGTNLNVGIATAWKWYGDGSSLTSVGSSAYAAQNVTASAAETIIDLTYGNLVYLTQSSDTTVGFASTAATQQVTIVRNTDSSNTITWPDRITWSGGSAPTLLDNPDSAAFQVFRFLSVDTGLTYNGWEEMKNAPTITEAYVWGRAVYGHLGLNDNVSRSSPMQIPGTNWATLNTGGGWSNYSEVARKTDGTLWSWGYGSKGQLGLNQTGPSTKISSPIQVGSDADWIGYPKIDHHMAHMNKSDGSLWTMGRNEFGALGLNDTVWRSSPTQIGTDTDWATGRTESVVSKDGRLQASIKTDGTLWVWGRNYYVQLGLNQSDWAVMYSSPVQLPGTNWRSVHGTSDAVGATKTDGTLWSWGYGGQGNSGQNNKTTYSSPKQVGTDTTWTTEVSVTGTTVNAIKTDGTLWSWGYNNYGGLGLNDVVKRSSPTQVGTDTTWSQVQNCSDYGTSKALKTDGTLWMWGNNQFGRLGLNNLAQYSSPTQIGTATNWSLLSQNGAIKTIE